MLRYFSKINGTSVSPTVLKFRLFICTILFSSINLFGQNTFDFTVFNEPIPEALRQLSILSGKNIAFSERFFQKGETVTFSKKNAGVRDILIEILKNQPVEFKDAGRRIIISKKKVETFTVSGYLTDASTGERLIFANIFTNYGNGTTTNEYGFYSLTLPEGPVKLSFSFIGYEEQTEAFELDENKQINIKMPASLTLAEVIVTPGLTRQIEPSPSGLSAKKFNRERIRAIPDFGGESDVIRVAGMLPGIQNGTDGTGGMYVRGGDADQNLFLLDGVPVYHAGHLFNMFSIYNTHAIRSARFITGGFPARYGGRLSSVFDVRTREGNLNQWEASAEVGLISAKLTTEGPFKKGKGAILVSGRLGLLEYVNGGFASKIATGEVPTKEDEIKREFHFFDTNVKANFDFGNDRLYFSGYFGRDIYLEEFRNEADERRQTDAMGINWGNLIFSLRHNRQINPKLFVNNTLTYSNYNYFFKQLSEDFEEDSYFFLGQASDITDYNVQSDFDWRLSPKHHVRFGAGVTQHFLRPTDVFVEDDPEDEEENEDFELFDFEDNFKNLVEYSGTEAFSYFEDEMNLTPSARIAAGLRLSGYLSEDFTGFFSEPRFFVSQRLSPKLRLNASASRMVQYLHRAVTSNLNLPDSKWTPPTNRQRPETSWQETFGFEFQPKPNWTGSSEVYYKTMNNQVLFEFRGDQNIEQDFFVGSGTGYGWETMIEKRGKTGGNLNYTLAWADRTYTNYNSGNSFPFQFDRRHSVKAHFYHKFNSYFRTDLAFIYFTPNPIVPVIVEESIDDEDENENINIPSSEQFVTQGRQDKPIHRLDFSAQYAFKKGRFGHQFKVSVFNVYDRKNIHFNKIEIDEDGDFNPRGESVELFGIRPSFSYKLDLK